MITRSSTATDTNTSSVFIGRQPIFDREQNVYAYELLYRSSATRNSFAHTDGDQATNSLIDTSLNVLSLDDLVGKHRAFVNITRKLLLDQTYSVLPKERVVLELLENIEPDAEVIESCRLLKQNGYSLALDDFEFRQDYRPLLELADIVKIDFLLCQSHQRQRVMQEYGLGDASLLAEKIEGHDDFKQAVDLGYAYFQGYFFCKPQIMQSRDIPANKANYLLFLQELNRPSMDYDKLESIIKRELSLSVRLLKYLNSASIGMRHRISSIHHALTLMGEGPLRKWASIVAMIAIADNKPLELMTTCLVRGRFCEQMGNLLGMRTQQLDLFLIGLFSGIDALMDRPMEDILAAMPLSRDVREALVGMDTPLSRIYRLAMAMERGNLTLMNMFCKQLELDVIVVGEIYRKSLQWADENMPK